MLRSRRVKSFTFLGFALLAPLGMAVITAVGCKGGSGGCDAGGGPPVTAQKCYDYATCYKPSTKSVSFKSDVLPVFEQSCSLSMSCHGTASSPTTSAGYQPYLGKTSMDTTPSDVSKILMLIVGQPSPTATNEKIVDPGHPETSFLMQKMDGTVMCSSIQCISAGCGTSMPQNVEPLPAATRDKIRDWIKQGAQNN
jgi:hypothetical protein